MSQSLLQPDGERECFITGFQSGLERHHVFHGSANRKLAERYGCWCWLTREKHRQVHEKDKRLDRWLQQQCQMKFEEKYSHELFMETFGRNYLDQEEKE